MKLIYLKSELKCDSFDVAIDIKILFFRVLVTIEPGRSLLQFVTTNCLTRFLLERIWITILRMGVQEHLCLEKTNLIVAQRCSLFSCDFSPDVRFEIQSKPKL